ncbi:MAG: hypothetical protein OEU92_08655 [Alphaproteobacteria bacterium]|nr:hypothetical protein [Alphaproteobacteria bacterium]
MGLLGAGAVAIWHDITAEGRENFYAWHGREHMPERVGIPGFLRGRRYVAIDAKLEYFNLYEAKTTAVLSGPAYLDRLNNPTPWTLESVKHFRDVARSICQVTASFGEGQGGLITTCCYDVSERDAEQHATALSSDLLPKLGENAMVAGVHLLIADADASLVDSAERKARGVQNRVPRWIILVEGWGDEEPFATLCAEALDAQSLSAAGATGPIDRGLYRIQATTC